MFLYLLISSLFATNLPSGEIKTIEIKADQVDLVLAVKETGTFQWNATNSGEWDVNIKDNVLHFTSDSDKIQKLKISGPSKAIRAFIRKGSFTTVDWQSPLYIRSLDIAVKLVNTDASIDLYTEKGQILISNAKGSAKIYAGNAITKIDGFAGSLYIEQFSGELTLINVDGETEILTQKTKTISDSSKGSLTYNSDRGDLVLNGFSGSLRGKSKKGLNVLNPAANAKVYWRADEGNLRLGVKKINGAYLDIATKKGDLYLVPPLKARSEGIWRVARAKLKGSQSGSVRIRTNTANVRVKYD